MSEAVIIYERWIAVEPDGWSSDLVRTEENSVKLTKHLGGYVIHIKHQLMPDGTTKDLLLEESE